MLRRSILSPVLIFVRRFHFMGVHEITACGELAARFCGRSSRIDSSSSPPHGNTYSLGISSPQDNAQGNCLFCIIAYQETIILFIQSKSPVPPVKVRQLPCPLSSLYITTTESTVSCISVRTRISRKVLNTPYSLEAERVYNSRVVTLYLSRRQLEIRTEDDNTLGDG